MLHETSLIATIVASISLAFVLGAVANHLRISPLVGYLLAGVAIGPFTPGFVADQKFAAELAEIGVVLLMFGVGLHFSVRDLLSVARTAVPGAIVEIIVVTVLGAGLAHLLGWSLAQGLVFGLSLSVASTVVLTRNLQNRRLLSTERGRIAVGWLVVEDLVMVLAIVLLPAIAGSFGETAAAHPAGAEGQSHLGELAITLAITVSKIALFATGMLLVGRRVIPWILHYIAHTGSRELFRLAVLSIALGIAFGAAVLFDVSVALGAFFAGMVLSESELSQRAAEESLPLRDAFAVLFFVSIGMLVDPMIVARQPGPTFATVLIVILGKPVAAFLIMRGLGRPMPTALMIAVSLSQIGEFSFILIGLAVSQNFLPVAARDLILAASILSILLNPAMFYLMERFRIFDSSAATGTPTAAKEQIALEPVMPTALRDHAVLVGYGRVGSVIGEAMRSRKVPLLVIEEQPAVAEKAKSQGIETLLGNAATTEIIEAANVRGARWVFVAIPNGFESGQIVEQAKMNRPAPAVIARAHSDAEVAYLTKLGADVVILGEKEIALGMLDAAFAKQDAPI